MTIRNKILYANGLESRPIIIASANIKRLAPGNDEHLNDET